jgi:hypothetical protein
MFVLLTFSYLFISRKCVLVPNHPCLSCSLFPTFLSLGSACFSPITHVCLTASACFSPVAHVCLTHFFLPSHLSRECACFPHSPCLSCSLFLAFSSLGSVCISPITMFVLLTFSPLLVSSECVLFPHHQCSSGSLFLTFSSLGSACFSPITHVCLTHFFLPSCL